MAVRLALPGGVLGEGPGASPCCRPALVARVREMDALQFSLFFVALLVGYLLVHLRLIRCETHLQKLAGIRALDDRLRSLDDRLARLSEVFEKFRVDRIEAQLERLHDDLEDVRDATTLVRQAVVQIPAPASQAVASLPSVPVPALVEDAAGRVCAVVETRLLQLGYGRIQILTDLTGLVSTTDVELQVEAERNGMPMKGRVTVRNGSVRDVALQSVVQMFP